MTTNYMAEGWDLPDPSPVSAGRTVVALAPLVAAKAKLYRAIRKRRVGISPQQAQRLFSIRHASCLDRLEAAMRALAPPTCRRR